MLIESAIIQRATITTEERGLLSAWLDLDYGGSGQCFGGYALYLPKSFRHHGGPNFAGHFIYRCMEVADVTDWAKMVGRTIRVRKQDRFSTVAAIGHIVKDDWFDPTADFERMKADAAKWGSE